MAFSQFQGSRGDVLTCHNTAFLDIQQTRKMTVAFSFTAVAKQCLKAACYLQSGDITGPRCPPWLMRENSVLKYSILLYK